MYTKTESLGLLLYLFFNLFLLYYPKIKELLNEFNAIFTPLFLFCSFFRINVAFDGFLCLMC